MFLMVATLVPPTAPGQLDVSFRKGDVVECQRRAQTLQALESLEADRLYTSLLRTKGIYSVKEQHLR